MSAKLWATAGLLASAVPPDARAQGAANQPTGPLREKRRELINVTSSALRPMVTSGSGSCLSLTPMVMAAGVEAPRGPLATPSKGT